MKEHCLKPEDVVLKGNLLYHVPTNISVVVKRPQILAERRRAEGSLSGLVRFAGRHDDRSVTR